MYKFGALVAGGLVGAVLLDRLKGSVVKKLFGGLLIFAGLNMAGVLKF